MWGYVYNDIFDAEKSCQCKRGLLIKMVIICGDRPSFEGAITVHGKHCYIIIPKKLPFLYVKHSITI